MHDNAIRRGILSPDNNWQTWSLRLAGNAGCLRWKSHQATQVNSTWPSLRG